MPRSTLRDAMWHEMLRLCGGRNQWQNRQQGQNYKARGWRNEGQNRPSEERIDVKLSKDSTLCLALLEAPELATEVKALADRTRQLEQAGRLARWLLENNIQTRKALVAGLATDKQARDRFYNLFDGRSEEHTSELQSRPHLVCRLLLEKKKQPLWSSMHL